MAKLETGYFLRQIPYARVGTGPANVVFLTGGPGNDTPHSMEVSMTLGGLKDAADEFTFWVTSRRNGQPKGYGTREMAADTAAVIQQTFPSGVAAVMGISYGGMIAQYIAAGFPGLVPRYVFIAAAHKVSPEVAAADLRFAEHLAAGRNGRAFREVAGYLYPPGPRRTLMRALLFALGGLFMGGKHHSEYQSDVIREARVEAQHDSLSDLGRIVDKVLIVGGDRDIAFPKPWLEETAAAIPGAQLRLYPGRGHGGVTTHPRFAADVLEFLR